MPIAPALKATSWPTSGLVGCTAAKLRTARVEDADGLGRGGARARAADGQGDGLEPGVEKVTLGFRCEEVSAESGGAMGRRRRRESRPLRVRGKHAAVVHSALPVSRKCAPSPRRASRATGSARACPGEERQAVVQHELFGDHLRSRRIAPLPRLRRACRRGESGRSRAGPRRTRRRRQPMTLAGTAALQRPAGAIRCRWGFVGGRWSRGDLAPFMLPPPAEVTPPGEEGRPLS